MEPSDGAGVGVEQVLQAGHDGLEAGALRGLAGPAVGHELQVACGHVWRYRRPVPRKHFEQDLQTAGDAPQHSKTGFVDWA